MLLSCHDSAWTQVLLFILFVNVSTLIEEQVMQLSCLILLIVEVFILFSAICGMLVNTRRECEYHVYLNNMVNFSRFC